MQFYHATGVLKYNPSTISRKDPWWVILECPMDIVNYYRYWILREKHIKVTRSLWGPHISVLRGEEPVGFSQSYWAFNDGAEIPFFYSPVLENNEEYWWLRVYCKELEEIRVCYGLLPEPHYGFHLTVGRRVKPQPSRAKDKRSSSSAPQP